jgi:radical SAM protein with 4Fe4S-binding SPASM domain
LIPYTKLKEHKRHNLRGVIPLEKPYTLIIEPTNACNFRCIQCFQSIREDNYFTRNKMLMSLECFKQIIEQMKRWKGPKLKVLKLSLYGEPLLNPNFCKMLNIAKNADIAERIETTTNASLLTEDICAKLVEYGLNYIRVSIYSAIREKHYSVTNSKIDIQTIHDNLFILKRIKQRHKSDIPFVGVKMLDTYSKENDLFVGMFKDVSDEVYLDKPHNWIAYKGKNFIDSLYGNEVEKAITDVTMSNSNRIACTLPFFTLAVRSNGDVSPCCIDWIGGTNIGNIYKETLEDIWYGDRMFEFRKMQLEDRKNENESCRNCELFLSDYYTRDNIDGFPVEKLRIKKNDLPSRL